MRRLSQFGTLLLCVLASSACRPKPPSAMDPISEQLKRIAVIAAELPGSPEAELDKWARVSRLLTELKAAGQLTFTNKLLVPDFDVAGEGLDLLRVNDEDLCVEIIDLNRDGRLDMVISAYDTRIRCNGYYFLILINGGKRLEPALRTSTGFANGRGLPQFGYRLTPAPDGKTWLFHTWETDLVDFYDARTWKTTELIYALDEQGRYQLKKTMPCEKR